MGYLFSVKNNVPAVTDVLPTKAVEVKLVKPVIVESKEAVKVSVALTVIDTPPEPTTFKVSPPSIV